MWRDYKKIKIKKLVQSKNISFENCDMCNGSGQITRANAYLDKCKQVLFVLNAQVRKSNYKKPIDSDENGMIRKESLEEIEIPAGVSEGMQLKIPSAGNEARSKELMVIYWF